MKKIKGFTLIELIIVVVIIGILALIAIPRYFASVTKAERSQVLANMATIREALLAYYAVNSAYPPNLSFPITVIVDGETVLNLSQPASSKWRFTYWTTDSIPRVFTDILPGYTGTCWMRLDSGNIIGTCPPTD
ncbi:MAG: prepilin-type N-terminal cleavage/methylation domain-containing protein [Candidatus Omnitrophota bacterium]|jgi:prepilin-type N-terminal cleavage/methylation domain-containing protein